MSLSIPDAWNLAAHVDAVDFSSAMLDTLRARADGLDHVHLHEADGQALPFPDGIYDAGFSMFGLMFFPDRARGWAGLRRVLRPGGRAVVASWHPLDQISRPCSAWAPPSGSRRE